MNKKFKALSSILALTFIIQLLSGVAAYAANEPDPEYYPTWYLKECFGSASSWDKARAWNGTNYGVGSGLNGVALTDNSDTQRSEAYRAINEIKSGVITLDFDFRMDRYTDGVGFRLLNDMDTVFGIVTKGTGLHLEQPGNQTLFLHDYKTFAVNKDVINYIVAHIDLDNKRILDVYINGTKCVEDKPLVTDAELINGFDIETTEKDKVLLDNQRIYIYKGYIVREDFFDAQRINPIGWEYENQGGTLSVYAANNRNVDRYSMQMNTAEGSIKAIKKFNAVGGHLVFETSVLQPKKRAGINISLNSGNSPVLSVISDGNSFKYLNNGTYTPFYDYLQNAWYIVKFDIDLENQTAKLYLNNKLKAEGISVNTKTVDNITVTADRDEKVAIIDDVKLYHPQEFTGDYVPEPQKPQKDSNFLFGMQMCPLWTEGLYTKAWDYVKAAPDRMPILGAYDEGNPEVNDWIIKWLVDHGYDFQWVCHYPSYQMNFSSTAVNSPIKPDMCRDGNSLYEGFMNSKYGNDFKFAIVMENSFLTQGAAIRPYFFDALVPYWIEYYFKDPRYLKIDGRPIVSVYLMDDFLNMFTGMDGLSGNEAIKAGVDKFKKMCVDAGVGEPYLLSQAGDVSCYLGKSYVYYAQVGVDGINAYGYPQQTTLGQQMQILENGLVNSDKYGVDTVPCLVPIRGDDPWLNGQNSCGYKSTSEEFEYALNWAKERFANASQSKLSKQMVMTATWDEFGEGHTMCPNQGDGFKYLDCVRKVFCGSDKHEEAVPTAQQKERVNKLVVQDRKPGFLSDAKLYLQVLENPRREVPSTVKYEWDFTNIGEENIWGVSSDISDASLTSNGWVLQPSSSKPTIAITKKVAYDICDVTYIRIRMKQSKFSTGGYAYWITSANGDYNEKEMVCHFSASVDGEDEFRDYYIPVGEKVRWRDNLKGLKINLGVVTDTADNFVVQSIAFLSDDELTKMTKVNTDGANYVLNPAPVEKNGVTMLPLREVSDILGFAIEFYGRTNSYLLVSKNQVEVTEGKTEAKKNAKTITIPEAPYRISKRINDTVYVPMSVFEEATGRKFTYDKKNNIINVEAAKSNTKVVNRRILGELTGGDAQAFYNLDGVNKITYDNGKTIIESGGYPTPLSRAFQGINMDEVKVVAFKFDSSGSGSMKFLYNSREDTLITADKASRAIPVAAGENYIEETTSSLYNWTGTADIFRFQPPAKKTIELEWIRFLGDPLPEKEGAKDLSSSMDYEDDFCSWEFEKNTEFNGWSNNKFIGDMSIVGGALNFVIAGANPMLTTYGNLDIDASKIDSIDICLRNNTAANGIKLYFAGKNEKVWGNAKCFDISISPNDQYDKTYHIDVGSNSAWSGKIGKFMLAPQGRKGDISIDYIRLNYKAE